jgi:hypothetical protein
VKGSWNEALKSVMKQFAIGVLYGLVRQRGRFEEKLTDAVLKNSPHLHREQLEKIFDVTGEMWDEWYYFALRIRKGEEEATLTLVNYGPLASYFISVQ